MKSESERVLEARTKIAGWIVTPLIGGLFLMWYNHVLLQYPLGYWKLVLLAVPVTLMQVCMKETKYIVAITAILAMFGQVLAWIGLVHLPLSHL